jgi:hypothetical protein
VYYKSSPVLRFSGSSMKPSRLEIGSSSLMLDWGIIESQCVKLKNGAKTTFNLCVKWRSPSADVFCIPLPSHTDHAFESEHVLCVLTVLTVRGAARTSCTFLEVPKGKKSGNVNG